MIRAQARQGRRLAPPNFVTACFTGCFIWFRGSGPNLGLLGGGPTRTGSTEPPEDADSRRGAGLRASARPGCGLTEPATADLRSSSLHMVGR